MPAYINLPNGVRVFYRSTGPPTAPVLLLLHGFPSSSNQFRNMIPILAAKYRVIAPDLPGFGFTSTPSDTTPTPSQTWPPQASFSSTPLTISKYAVYVFDHGAPAAWRIALQHPSSITAIISQNGSSYAEGLGQQFWAPSKAYWADPTNAEKRNAVIPATLTFETTKWQYENGEPEAETRVDPASYHLDWALLSRPGSLDVQLDLFKDYGSNVALYPRVHQYFRESRVPLLALWGKNDLIFVPEGAEAFRKDLPDAEVEFLDAGHFAADTHADEIAERVLRFLGDKGV